MALNRWQFFGVFLRDWRVASVTPTSRRAVVRLCRAVDFALPQTVVELGPGSGAFTRYLLSRLPAGSRVVAIEQNAHFAAALRSSITDPRLTVVEGSAEHLRELLSSHGVRSADVVLSGIPFSVFSRPRQQEILRQVAEVLAPAGVLLAYQFSSQLAAVLPAVFPRRDHFRLWWNIPPLHCFVARLR